MDGVKYSFQSGSETGVSTAGDTLSRYDITVNSQLDTSQAGTYPVYFSYQNDRCQGATQLLVVVE